MKNFKKTSSIFNLRKILVAALGIITFQTASAQISLGTGTTIGAFPVHTSWNYSYSQQIYFQNEINAGSAGNITGITFHAKPNESISNSGTWKVYLGNTNKSQFSSRTDWIPVTAMTEVFNGTVINNNGEITVTFTTPFLYDNISNLVIAVDENAPGENSTFPPFYVYGGSQANSVFHWSSTNINPVNFSNGTSTSISKSRITILGLTPNNLSVSDTTHTESNIKLYPNPVKDILNISDVSKVKHISVSDASGRLVKSVDKPDLALDIRELKSGMYMVTLEMNDGSKQTVKTIKK